LYDKLIEAQAKMEKERPDEQHLVVDRTAPAQRGLGCFAKGCLILVSFSFFSRWHLSRHLFRGEIFANEYSQSITSACHQSGIGRREQACERDGTRSKSRSCS